ncbi:MAG: thiamine pyrophosphate-dependent dehydrogenase E1 component subunit alpha [Vicinamibacterales bacterium]|nr:thiamine pyrophosphate-dependent dehydrogenase E1 component subunit alpha [Vicinamibacterales bacterium]
MATENPASFLDPALDRTSIAPEGAVDRDQLVTWYRTMRLARTCDEKLGALYRQGKIVGAVYLAVGQEAICTGVVSLLQPDDYFSTVARGLAGWFLRGVEPRHVIARWLGRDVPPSHGRELGLFLADIEHHGIAPYHNGSMASWIPSGAGFALAFKVRKQPRVYVAFTGDGATSPGDFYEGLNFAAIHKLPLVVIVENNCFAYSTGNAAQMPVENVADRAPAFNIPADVAFGNDIFEVRRVAKRAIDHARAGKGPYLVEFKTFRTRGHGEHDDMGYVDAGLREFWERRDPLRLFSEYLAGAGGLGEAAVRAIDDECAASIEEAVAWAEAQPAPAAETVTDRLFAP